MASKPGTSRDTTGAAGLTGKRRRFVEEYLVDCNATRAYVAAGYTAKNANVAGVEAHRLLKDPKVAAAVAAGEKAKIDATIATREERHQFLTAALRGQHGGELKDRLKATELLGKAQGDFIDRHEHKVELSFADLVAKSQEDEA